MTTENDLNRLVNAIADVEDCFSQPIEADYWLKLRNAIRQATDIADDVALTYCLSGIEGRHTTPDGVTHVMRCPRGEAQGE